MSWHLDKEVALRFESLQIMSTITGLNRHMSGLQMCPAGARWTRSSAECRAGEASFRETRLNLNTIDDYEPTNTRR